MEPSQELHQRIAKLLGTSPRDYRRVHGGYTPAARWICVTDAGSCFIKAATTPLTAGFLRREIRSYNLICGDFMPEPIAWEDHETQPVLILEDLSQQYWPPPWTQEQIEMALNGIREMHSAAAPLDSFAEAHGSDSPGWPEVARDPQPFLALGFASADWLERALTQLLYWEAQCPTEGDAVTHGDIRSDNLCLKADRAVLIDWNCACRSNPRLDLGFWLPSLASEGGPEPESLLPDAPEVAARVAGYFACRAGQPDIPDAPRVRQVQRRQLEFALPWAARELDLPPPTGE